MSVQDGQRANETTFNDAFLCKAKNETVVGTVTLDAPASGATVANAQQAINDNIAEIASNDVDIADLQLNKENKSEKNQPNGYAGLDANGKVDPSLIVDGYLFNRGPWDASTNTPALANGTGTNGDRYRVNVAGTQDLGAGTESYAVGDTVTYNGTIWQREDFVGVESLEFLSDVDITTVAPVNNDILIYNSVTTKWENKPQPSSGEGLQVDLVSFGTGFWNTTNDDLVLDSNHFVSVPGVDTTFNSILAQSINMTGSDDVAYVDVDLTATAPVVLPVTVVSSTSFVAAPGRYIIARRVGVDTFFGIWNQERIGDGETVFLGSDADDYRYAEASNGSFATIVSPVANQWYANLNAFSINITRGTWAVNLKAAMQFINSLSTNKAGIQIALATSTVAGSGALFTAWLGDNATQHKGVNVAFPDLTVSTGTNLYIHWRCRSGFGTYGVNSAGWRNDLVSAGQARFWARKVRS